MAPPHGETHVNTYTLMPKNLLISKPPRMSNSCSLQRTMSDISTELIVSKEDDQIIEVKQQQPQPIIEVENAKCGCCGMSEECTPEYIEHVCNKFLGKWICGLCAEAVKEELEKNGGKRELDEALRSHMSACVNFNKFCRAYPVLYQAEAMREMLKKSTKMNRLGVRAKSFSPRDANNNNITKGTIARSSSCMPSITKEISDFKITH